MARGFCSSSSSKVGSAVGLMRENAWQCGQLRAVSRSSPKYIVPVESMNTFIAVAIAMAPIWSAACT